MQGTDLVSVIAPEERSKQAGASPEVHRDVLGLQPGQAQILLAPGHTVRCVGGFLGYGEWSG